MLYHRPFLIACQFVAQNFERLCGTIYSLTLKVYKMGSLLYILAVVLIVIWAISFLALHVTSGLIHLLLVVAVILFIVKLVTGRSV
jgi:hypothetical protein